MNKLGKTLIIILIMSFYLILTPKINFSADWRYLFTDEGAKFYVEFDSIKVNNKNGDTSFWIKADKPDGSSYISQELVKRNKKLHITQQITEYGRDGKSRTTPGGGETRHIVPGSRLEAVVNKVFEIKGIK